MMCAPIMNYPRDAKVGCWSTLMYLTGRILATDRGQNSVGDQGEYLLVFLLWTSLDTIKFSRLLSLFVLSFSLQLKNLRKEGAGEGEEPGG